MIPRPHRVLAAALICLVWTLALAAPAHADEWVVVVDAESAETKALEALPADAKALWTALAARKISARLVAARHPALALPDALADAGDEEAQVVVFVGAFDAAEAPDEEALAKARAAWDDAATGSRLLPLATMDAAARKTLDGLDGLADGGSIVLAFGTPALETEPFSPLDPDVPLVARVRVPTTLLSVAATSDGGDGHVLALESERDGDAVELQAGGEGALRFEIRRPIDGPRAGSATFRETEDARTYVLADPPAAVTWTWDRLKRDVRVRGVDGSDARPIDARDTEVGGPRELRYRVLATKPAADELDPAVFVNGTERPVAGLRAWIDGRAKRDAEVVEAVLRVRYAPKPASPQDVEGEIRVGGRSIPFHVSADAGRATLAATPPGRPVALPLARERETVTVQVRATNGNMPEATRFELACEPEAYAPRVRLRVFKADGAELRVAPGAAFDLPTGEAVEVVAELNDLEAWAALDPGTLRIRPAKQAGVVVEGALELPYRFRHPRLVVQDEHPRYELVDGVVEAVTPLRLALDADGGDGAWLLARLSHEPRVTERGTATLSDWEVVEEGRGTWRVEATGSWRGIEPAPFAADLAGITFRIEWDGGAVPGDVQATVDVPARWGHPRLGLRRSRGPRRRPGSDHVRTAARAARARHAALRRAGARPHGGPA